MPMLAGKKVEQCLFPEMEMLTQYPRKAQCLLAANYHMVVDNMGACMTLGEKQKQSCNACSNMILHCSKGIPHHGFVIRAQTSQCTSYSQSTEAHRFNTILTSRQKKTGFAWISKHWAVKKGHFYWKKHRSLRCSQTLCDCSSASC